MSETGKAVFLSYASQDADAAWRICEALRAAGVEVWFDQSELVGGDQWDAKIRSQISSCALFLPLISANTQSRLEGYFRLEWKLAAQRTHTMADEKTFLLPILLDGTRDAEAKVPAEFKAVQWTKLPGGETPLAFALRVKKLLDGEGRTGRHPGIAPSSPKSGSGHGTPPHRGLAKWWWALPVLGVTIVLLLVLKGTKPETPVKPPDAAPGPPSGLTAPATAGPPASAPPGEFPRDPDLKRVHQLIYNVVDGIAEDFALADDLVKPLLAARPNDPEVVTVAAELAQEFVTRGIDASTARRAQAQRLTERAVQLAPDNPEALAALGNYLYSTGTQTGRAEELLRRAIDLNPREPRFYCHLYQILAAGNKPTAEVDAFGTKMTAAFPRDALAAYVIAHEQSVRGDLAHAEVWLDRTLALAPVPTAIIAKARIMLEVHGDIEGMKRVLDRMPDRQRTSARLLNTYAVLATVTGQTAAARRLIDSITDTWLADGTYLFPKALLVGELDQIDGNDDVAGIQFEAALKEVRAKLAADPTDLRPVRAELWAQIGLGHREEARATLRLNLQRRPKPYRWTMGLTWWTSALRACLLLDERAEALALLKEATVEPTGRLLLRNLFQVDPQMAPYRGDPEIQALLAEPAGAVPSPAGAAAPKPDEKSVAVLAFENLSEDKGNEYFSDGISEELLNVLAKIPSLKVTARTSAFFFKGKDLPIPEIAQKLGVAYVVEGSVRKAGDKVRITAELIKAADGFHVWGDTFTRDLKDIFAVQDEIAGLIAQQLSLKMGVNAARAPASVNPLAFELYVQARQALSRRDSDGFDRAEQLLVQVLQLEPGLARAHAALADVWTLRANLREDIGYFGQRDAPIFARIEAEIGRALALDPDSAEARASLGFVRYMEWRFVDAERELRRAVTLNPNYPTGHHWLGLCLTNTGAMDEGLAEYERAAQLDPFSFRILENYGAALNNAGRREAALVMIDRSLELQPKSGQTLQVKLNTLLPLGRHAEAEAIVRELPESDAKFYLVALGRRTEAEVAFAKASDRDRTGLLFSLGRFDEWFDRFNPADFYVSGINGMLYSKAWDPVRKDPRFGKLVAGLGLTEAHARAQAWRAAHPPDKPEAQR